jgi:uncharacterized protein YwgA
MKRESFRWLAALIAAHPQRKLVGRTRLQKEVKLLQRRGFPTGYTYSIHFYGPYSEDLNADLKVARQLELVQEDLKQGSGENAYYTYRAAPEAILPEIDRFQSLVDLLKDAEDVPLELAATYDAFRELGCDHAEALRRLRRKKGPKCDGDNVTKALQLLKRLGLPTT